MTETLFVRDGLARLAARLAELGTRRALVLAPPSRRFVDGVVAALAAFDPVVFDGARVHVPAEVVEAADARLRECGADTIVAIGGGSPIGLGKALRLRHDVRFVAIPTTYSGSEMTTMFGVTHGRDKTTGRDPKVRPALVLYDVAFTQQLPIALTVQSLCNAIAHVVSIVSTGLLAEPDRRDAYAAARQVLDAIDALLVTPTDPVARELALHGASACAVAFDRGKAGVQHALAHLLGGALNLDHAALHAVLLPHFVSYLRTTQPAVVDDLELALGRSPLATHLHDVLVRAGTPVSLDALGAAADVVEAALATRPELPAEIARAAQHG